MDPRARATPQTAPSPDGGAAGGFLRRRHKGNRAVVACTEVVARALITAGGAGTILAVSGVFLFLVWVVSDLFLPAHAGDARAVMASAPREVLCVGADEYRVLGWLLRDDGVVETVGLRDGKALGEHRLLEDGSLPRATCAIAAPTGRRTDPLTAVVPLVLGFADGTVRTAEIRITTSYREADEVPTALRGLAPGGAAPWNGGIAEVTPIGQFRLQVLSASVGPPVGSETAAPLVAVQMSEGDAGPVVAAVDARGDAWVCASEKKLNPLTGDETLAWGTPLALPAPARAQPPAFVALLERGDNAVLGWRDGHAARFAISEQGQARLVETTRLLEEADRQVTSFGLLLGGGTLLIGDSGGGVGCWFVCNDAQVSDGLHLTCGHRIALPDASAVRCFAASERERLCAIGTDDGSLHVVFVTSEKHVVRVRTGRGDPVSAAAIAPKNDALLAVDASGVTQWAFEPRYPDVTLGTLFRPVWYERYSGPSYVWQSSSGADDFERKISLVPLVFGTLKATVYSMLFGVPLALLAAIYTSEFLGRRARGRIKPVIEMMASLPSVVLGFLAALVIAPMVEQLVPAILCGLVVVPFCVVLGAYLWRLLPSGMAQRLEPWRLFANAATLVLGVGLALVAAPAMEALLFGGDLFLWLDGRAGSGVSGLFLMLLPLTACAVFVLASVQLNPRLRRWTAEWSPRAVALLHLGKFAAAVVVVTGLATAAAFALDIVPTWFGMAPLDLRGGLTVGSFDLSPLGTYDQRNAMVVGVIMGFAVIPIIYTLAEDALSSVPEHLRAASLGAGATPWQTATRIVIPTAMSGLFSAVMIGLGRAVGETMIVLMAAGNTPVLSMNAFSGFRTLSANLATELPEAAQNTSHYRTLFLAALVLFAITFLINTLAESVRLRFRKRAYQL